VTFQYLESSFRRRILYSNTPENYVHTELFNEKLFDDGGGALVPEYLIQKLVSLIHYLKNAKHLHHLHAFYFHL
jgi:hypothetical protein